MRARIGEALDASGHAHVVTFEGLRDSLAVSPRTGEVVYLTSYATGRSRVSCAARGRVVLRPRWAQTASRIVRMTRTHMATSRQRISSAIRSRLVLRPSRQDGSAIRGTSLILGRTAVFRQAHPRTGGDLHSSIDSAQGNRAMHSRLVGWPAYPHAFIMRRRRLFS